MLFYWSLCLLCVSVWFFFFFITVNYDRLVLNDKTNKHLFTVFEDKFLEKIVNHFGKSVLCFLSGVGWGQWVSVFSSLNSYSCYPITLDKRWGHCDSKHLFRAARWHHCFNCVSEIWVSFLRDPQTSCLAAAVTLISFLHSFIVPPHSDKFDL